MQCHFYCFILPIWPLRTHTILFNSFGEIPAQANDSHTFISVLCRIRILPTYFIYWIVAYPVDNALPPFEKLGPGLQPPPMHSMSKTTNNLYRTCNSHQQANMWVIILARGSSKRDLFSTFTLHRLLGVPFRSVDRASLSREWAKGSKPARRDWSEQTSRGERRPCFRIALNPTDIKRLLAV